MISWTDMGIALVTRVGTGLFFFGGLLWTVRRIPRSKHPRTMVWSSFLIRQAVSVTVLINICRDMWECWAVALIGFLVVRTFMIKGQNVGIQTDDSPKGGHAGPPLR